MQETRIYPSQDGCKLIGLAGLDALGGLMLTLVLADHCGGMLTEGRFISQWKSKGLGRSDAAAVFPALDLRTENRVCFLIH